jgi:hypothetical protein
MRIREELTHTARYLQFSAARVAELDAIGPKQPQREEEDSFHGFS